MVGAGREFVTCKKCLSRARLHVVQRIAVALIIGTALFMNNHPPVCADAPFLASGLTLMAAVETTLSRQPGISQKKRLILQATNLNCDGFLHNKVAEAADFMSYLNIYAVVFYEASII